MIKQPRNLKASKSSGAYHISNKIIKLSNVIIASILTKLLNDSFRQGVYPNVLKIALVIPIHKSGSKNQFSNYRPVSILSSFSKIFKKCVYKQISSCLTKKKKKKLNPQHYGFRPNYSTSIALNGICNKLLHNLEENKISCTMFSNLAKVFDTIDHTILIKTIRNIWNSSKTIEKLSKTINRKQQTLYQ